MFEPPVLLWVCFCSLQAVQKLSHTDHAGDQTAAKEPSAVDTGTFEAQDNSGGISQVNTHICLNALQAFTAHDHLADQQRHFL